EVPHGSYRSAETRVYAEDPVVQLAGLTPLPASQRIVEVEQIGQLKLRLEVIGEFGQHRTVFPLGLIGRTAVERRIRGQQSPVALAQSLAECQCPLDSGVGDARSARPPRGDCEPVMRQGKGAVFGDGTLESRDRGIQPAETQVPLR